MYMPIDRLRDDFFYGKVLRSEKNFRVVEVQNKKSHQKYCVFERIIQSEEIYMQYVKDFKTYDSSIDHHSIARFKFWSYEMILSGSKKHYIVNYLVDHFDSDLAILYNQNKLGKTFLLPNSFRGLLKDLISAFSYLAYLRLIHKEVIPMNFFISLDGKCKFDGLLLGNAVSQYTNLNYVAPEILNTKAVAVPKYFEAYCKANVFSLGVVLLQIASMSEPIGWNEKEEIIKEKLMEVKSRYGMDTFSALSLMLKFHPSERMDFLALYKKFCARDKKEGGSGGGAAGPLMALSGDPNACFKIDAERVGNHQPPHLFHFFITNSMSMFQINYYNPKAIFMEKIEVKMKFLVPNGHRSTMNEKGDIFLVGGKDNSGIYKFDLNDQSLVKQAKLPADLPILDFGLAYIQKKLYIFGGIILEKGVTNETYSYVPGEDLVYEKSPMMRPVHSFGWCVVSDRFIYRFGGILGGTGQSLELCNDIEKYDSFSDKWSTLGFKVENNKDFPLLWGITPIPLNENSIFCVGGMDKTGQMVNRNFILTDLSEENPENTKDYLIHKIDEFLLPEGEEIENRQTGIIDTKLYVLMKKGAKSKKIYSFHNFEGWLILKTLS